MPEGFRILFLLLLIISFLALHLTPFAVRPLTSRWSHHINTIEISQSHQFLGVKMIHQCTWHLLCWGAGCPTVKSGAMKYYGSDYSFKSLRFLTKKCN